MTTLHTFGCSITQGFALPDIVKPVLDSQGQPLTEDQVQALGDRVKWTDIHVYEPSRFAWPQVLADRLGIAVENHARRGACFHQIARQCAVAAPRITAEDTVIVMWTYFSRLSLQWPARTAVPFCNIVDPSSGWVSRVLPGFNKFFGLTPTDSSTAKQDQRIHQYIERAVKHTHLDPLAVYDRYYNNLVLQVTVDGLLRSTGARVIHLSVETEPYIRQLELARSELDPTLREPYVIPDPESWYQLAVDHLLCHIIHDPSIPPAKNDMHPSELHHSNFAQAVHRRYFE